MKLAIFDFDGTLFPHDTIPYLLTQWKKNKMCRKKHAKVFKSLIAMYIKYKLGIESKFSREEMKLFAVNQFNYIFDGMSEDEVLTFFNHASKSIEGEFNKDVVYELKNAQQAGYHTVLLSGSYTPLLEKVGKVLHIDTVIGTPMRFENGLYNGGASLDIASGMEKVHKIKAHFGGIDWENSIAYADSLSDLHLLEAVGHPTAVKPDQKLKVIAKDQNWRII